MNVNRLGKYYGYPNFEEIRDYLGYRKSESDAVQGKMPVTVTFTDRVPIQMIVNMIDICAELGITDFAINAKGIE